MVGTDNLKYDIEALSAERDALRKEVEALERQTWRSLRGC